jgi:hypothetical protein
MIAGELTALPMKLGDIAQPMITLLEDARAAETHLDKSDSQFARRAYVRSVFAAVEGLIWILKQVCLARLIGSKQKFKLAEFALLQDQTYDLKDNGETSVQTKFLPVPNNVKFTFRIFNRLFNSNVDLRVGAEPWTAFLRALEIRHRITHPKKVEELDISEEEIKICRGVSLWFVNVINTAMHFIVEASKPNAPRV